MNAAVSGVVTVAAPAKINLYLHVISRRADGYHELDSLMAFTDLGDSLTVEKAGESTIEASGPFADRLPDGEDNLVIRAALALGRVLIAASVAPSRISKTSTRLKPLRKESSGTIAANIVSPAGLS